MKTKKIKKNKQNKSNKQKTPQKNEKKLKLELKTAKCVFFLPYFN
jgi:hypothetical protein